MLYAVTAANPAVQIVSINPLASILLCNSGATALWIGDDPITLKQIDSVGNPTGIKMNPGQTMTLTFWKGQLYATCLTIGQIYVAIAYLENLNAAMDDLDKIKDRLKELAGLPPAPPAPGFWARVRARMRAR